ncbi:MAG: 50S ribosomal protein L25/general stress protein Ctc [Gammaproteobacteria bacterium]
MSDEFTLSAEPREDVGKGASRRLRRANKVPAIIYGADKAPESVSLDHDQLVHNLDNEAFYSHILTVEMGKKKEKVVLKDLQRHPYKLQVLHVDLQRVSAKEKLRMHVPLHFINESEAPGVREGGLVSHLMTEVEVQCLPKDLPEFIEVDLSNLELGGILHLADLEPPEGVEIYAMAHGSTGEEPVVSIHGRHAGIEEEEGGEEGEEGEEEV